MRRQTKAPSAFTLGRKAVLSLVLVAVSLLAFAPAAFAGTTVDRLFPPTTGSGTLGGQFNTPRGIAISESGAGAADPGDIYVVESSNHRIQRFSADGTFERAFGVDVVDGVANPGASGDTGTGAAAGFEICTNAAHCKQGLSGGGNAADNLRNGQLNTPQGIAINETTGDLYVRDRNNNRVNQYTADGIFIRSWGWDTINAASPGNVGTGFEICPATEICKAGAAGAGDGQFGTATSGDGTGIAIDPATKDVFVVDPGGSANRRVQRFEADGDYVAKLGGQGPGLGLFGTSSSLVLQPHHVEVSNGILYVSDCDGTSSFHQVERYDLGAATWLTPLNIFGASCSGTSNTNKGLAVDPDTGNLLVARPAAQGVLEYDVSVEPPMLVDTHVGTAGLLANGIVFRDDELYLTSSSSGAHRVYVADEDGNTDPLEVTIDPPTGIGAHTARFSGTVNPGGFPTSYRFEYSKTGAEGSWKAVAPMTLLGDGTSPVEVPLSPAQGEVSDLEANSLYRVRILGNRGFGNPDTASAEIGFFTHTVKPEAHTRVPQHVLDTSVQLVGKVNPNNLPTTYWFEYGAHLTYGSKAPVPSGSLASEGIAKRVVEQVAGLAPDTTYHYRVCAANSQGTHCGSDAAFDTRSIPSSSPVDRAYEMVTPPFKATRSNTNSSPPPGFNVNAGFPSHDGNAYAWDNFVFPLTEDVGLPADGDRRLLRRGSSGWTHQTINGRRPSYDSDVTPWGSVTEAIGSSGDFGTMAYLSYPFELTPHEGDAPLHLYTRRDGTGLAGFTPWMTDTDTQQADFGLYNVDVRSMERAIFNEGGTAMVRWGRYRGLGEDPDSAGDDDPSDEQQLPGVDPGNPLDKPPLGGHSIYLQRAADPADVPAMPKELVNECTGTGAGATLIPAREGSGVATDTISTQSCEEGNVTSERGAIAGHGVLRSEQTLGLSAGALSDDGRRIFFESPDPIAAPTNCATATGAATSCPPQLFVRQYDENGENPVVRWISRAQGIGTQQIGEMGTGAVYQGASKDGRYVYFTTNAPLTPDDPNGGNSITNGVASNSSYDLYRYELPESLNSDPASGTLLRVSGGPSGSADASTGASAEHASLRFSSDDGTRAYFLTERPIAGADVSAPHSGTTAPGNTGRNLYLFDSNETGAERYKFIANLPFAGSGNQLSCATAYTKSSRPLGSATTFRLKIGKYNCVRGTRDGSHITFSTFAQLTTDDDDSAGDIYLYDAEEDELVRVTAPGPGAIPYGCVDQAQQLGPDQPVEFCNGDQGFGIGGNGNHGTAAAGEMDAAGGWGGVGRYDGIATDASGAVSVFFESRSELLPEDTNGTHWDTYEWREGELSLVSPGNSPDHSWFTGNSTDGRDVFIVTSARLDPREIDPQDYDVYDARIGGGFPYTPPPTPCDVLALQCESEAVQAGVPGRATSATAISTGNLAPKAATPRPRKCGKAQVRRKGKCVVRKANRTRKRAGKTTRRAGR